MRQYGSTVGAIDPQHVPRTPTVGGTPSSKKNLDAGSSQFVIGMRVFAGAPDEAVADDCLANLKDGARQLGLDSHLVLTLREPVTRVDIVGVGTAAAGGCVLPTGAAASVATHKTTFIFDAPVSRVVVSITDSWNSGQEAQITIGS